MLRFLIKCLQLSLIKCCVKTIPPEEVFITSTDNPMEDLCTTCDIAKIAPTLADPTTTSFTTTELAVAGDCKQTKVECKRTDGQKCTEIGLNAKSGAQTSLLMKTEVSDTVTATLTCAEDGTYSSGAVTGITQLECVFEECAATPPCQTCKLIEPMMPDNTEIVIAQSVENGCNVATVTCKRTDDQICDRITHQGTIGNGIADISFQDNTKEAELKLMCEADGLYAGGSSALISQITCQFDGCKPPAPACPCNLESLAPTTSPPELVYEAEWTGPPGECVNTKIGCRKTNGRPCQLIELTEVSGVNIVVAIDGTSRETTDITCQPDGTFTYFGLIHVTGLFCQQTNCQ